MFRIYQIAPQQRIGFQFDKYYFASLFFVILQCAIVIELYIANDLKSIFYFCYHSPLFFAIFFYKRNITIIRSLITIGLIGQLYWSVDFLTYLVFDQFPLGISKTTLRYDGIAYITIISAHFLSSILALLLIYKEKLKEISIIHAFLYLFFIYALNIINILPKSLNVNYIWQINGFGKLPYHTELYWFYVFPAVILPAYVIQHMILKTATK